MDFIRKILSFFSVVKRSVREFLYFFFSFISHVLCHRMVFKLFIINLRTEFSSYFVYVWCSLLTAQRLFQKTHSNFYKKSNWYVQVMNIENIEFLQHHASLQMSLVGCCKQRDFV